MQQESIIRLKSYAFALKCATTCLAIQKSEKEYILTKQLISSATSIGANVEGGRQAQSKLDFIHKLSISQKEAFESNYWIRLLKDCQLLEVKTADDLLNDCVEIQKILTAILVSSKRNYSKIKRIG